MPEFVLNRNYNLIGRGHNIRFEKGAPTYVPPELVKDAVGIGADPVDGQVDVLGPDDESTVEALTPEEKEGLFNKTFDNLLRVNDREDFDASGAPAYEKLRALLPFAFTKKERNEAWRAFIAGREAQ